ncbi:recombinase family protein [Flavonifractor sp. An306]|uniref:recombinase family protein n=1 Tax=Flavonifractor sp. An306 TaxID=1965629 RepID=UPI000B39FD53|nr:recombinase family protein [Flavonifractor sp. An306]OUO38208.1 hypothetical protein B5F88_11790 [Flavonifractor sp. An306]
MLQKLAAYYRTSLEDFNRAHGLTDQSQSIGNQRKVIMEYLRGSEELSGYSVLEFIDDGLTGTNTDRPQFQAMIEAARRGEVSCIVVKDLSRFGRNYLDVGDYLEHIFPFLGVRIIAVNDGYDSQKYIGMTGGMDVAFRNFMYENYSRDLSIKVRSAMQARMKDGRFVNHVPYGYRKHPSDKHQMVPDEETAPIVREIFLSIIAGKSTTQIARELNARGVLTPLEYKQHRLKPACRERDLMWSHVTVLNILRNIKYTGSMANHIRENRYMRDRNQRRVPREEWIVTEGTHEAIVTKEEYEAAQAQIRSVKKHGRKPPDGSDRVFYCGHCGRKLRKSFGLDTYFACDTQLYQEQAPCADIRWSKTDLEAVLIPIYRTRLELMGEQTRNLQTAFHRNPKPSWDNRLEKIDQEITRQNARKFQYYEEYRGGAMSRELFLQRKNALADRVTELQAERTRIEAERQREQEAQSEHLAVQREAEEYLSASAEGGEAFKASMYDAIDRVTVFSDHHIEVRWKFEDLFAKLYKQERRAV